MVHNGIEYGDMQLICEAYQMMKDTLGMSHDEMSETFAEWNKGELDSFLIEISTNILKYRDESGDILLEKIKDSAGQKGTGRHLLSAAAAAAVWWRQNRIVGLRTVNWPTIRKEASLACKATRALRSIAMHCWYLKHNNDGISCDAMR